MKYAGVIIDISHEKVDRSFTYRIPEEMEKDLRIGMVVRVPFGRGDHSRKGYVVSISEESGYDPSLVKTILSVENSEETTESRMIVLAAWIRETYGCTMIQALRTVFPIQEKMRNKEKRRICLAVERAVVEEKLTGLSPSRYKARIRLLEALLAAGDEGLDGTAAARTLGAVPSVTGPLVREGLIRIEEENTWRIPFDRDSLPREMPKQLNPEQSEALSQILEEWETDAPRPVLLHGVTGSGKTEVYISIIKEICARGRQAIMLIPEISLSFQTLMRFYSHFGDRVSVVNSSLSDAERADQWERARRGEIDVIIGPRSALFTPFSNPGVIVIDEEHEHSYKNESMPKYQTRDVAEEIARMHGAVLVLGSATPSMESYYRAREGEIRLFRLKERLTGGTLPAVETVDMRAELKEGNRSILSRSLYNKIEDRLRRGQQSMLFINRRGFAGFVSCRSCGFVPKCPHCDVSLSLHGNGRLVCHYCGYERTAFRTCPECGSRYISAMRAGTEKIEGYLREIFPQARILRMDADTTRKKGSYEKILSAFSSEEADILLGTQMIVKGHDFPGVTLVGILMADLSLYGDDYRAAERTFQLLTQAAGRAGRGTQAGDVVIQTYQPDHYAVRHAEKQDFEGFYEEEIAYRKLLRYPPAGHMMAVQIQSEDEDAALGAANEIRLLLMREQFPTGNIPGEIMAVRETTGHGTEACSYEGSSGSFSCGESTSAGMTAPLRREKVPLRSVAALQQRDGRNVFQVIGPSGASLKKLRDLFRFVLYIKSEKYDTLVSCKDVIERMTSPAGQTGRADTGGSMFRNVDIQFDFDPINTF